MVALYITSTEATGKTALCAGIGRKLLDQGAKVGFLMPVKLSETNNHDGYEDVAFIKETLALTESSEQLCPICLPTAELWRSLTTDIADFTQKLKQAYRKISRDKDIVVMEGLGSLGVDKISTLACYTIAETFEAKVIILLRYSSTLDISKVVQVADKLGQSLLGVVINFVPESKIETVRLELAALFNEAGIKVLGILPEIRSLLGISVGELVKVLDGETLNPPDSIDDIVENVMVGAMSLDSGINYFNVKENKAVVVRGDRADMQLAALETSVKCLILTNNIKPLPPVISQAQDKHIPIVVVKQDTSAAISCIEDILTKSNFQSSRKLEALSSALDCYFDFKSLNSELGLKA